MGERHKAEWWVLMNDAKPKCFFQSGLNLYLSFFPREKYAGPRFAYLIQAEEDVPEHLREQLERPGVDTYLLTWRVPREGAIFFPKSTWTEGRNRLFQEVKDKDYDYYVFMDEDVLMTTDREGHALEVFEGLLEKYRPVIGVPQFPQLRGLRRNMSEGEVSTHYTFDAICTAIRKDALHNLMPYSPVDDDVRWHLSHLYFNHMARVCYPSQIAYFNDIEACNPVSRPYPRNGTFYRPCRAFRDTVLQPYQDRLMPHAGHDEESGYKDTGPLKHHDGEVVLYDHFDMESEFWKAHRELRDSVLSGRADSFSEESVKCELYHREHGSEETIREFGIEKVKVHEHLDYLHVLGDDYYHGRNGQSKDYAKAFDHWMGGAMMGHQQCIKNIIWAYESGIGCVPSKKWANYWRNR
jgi:hypothetical protein